MNIQAQLPATEGAAAVAELAGPLVVPSLADPGIWVCLGVGRGRCCLHGRWQPIRQPSPMFTQQREVRKMLTLQSPGLSSPADMGMPDAPDVWGHVKSWREGVSLGQERATAGTIQDWITPASSWRSQSETEACRPHGKQGIHSPRQIVVLMAYLTTGHFWWQSMVGWWNAIRGVQHRSQTSWQVTVLLRCHGRVGELLLLQVAGSSKRKPWTLLRWPTWPSPQF